MNVHFIQHVSFESPGTLIDWCVDKNHFTSFTRVYESSNFPHPGEIDLLVIMGGPMSVHDENQFAWLKEEKLFIKKYIATGKKILGICLGSQLLAEVLGARVFLNGEKEIGWWPVIKINKEGFENLPSEFETFHWHGETFDLPTDAQLLFSTEGCKNQGFLVGTQIAALQFHMEMDMPLMKAMVLHGLHELANSKYIQLENEMYENGIQFMAAQKNYISSFLDCFLNL
ncbi:MAG: amidotransferase [Bacteroidetes bacterium]|nr:MAG: amidotransferase [Bacteroidota bacterium]